MNSIGENMKQKNSNLVVLGAGFACLDIVKHQNEESLMLGGTAANVLTVLSLLGIRTKFLTAKYAGASGKWIREALARRKVECVFFSETGKNVPRIIEDLNKGKHLYYTVCPACGKNLVKCNLPSAAQIEKLNMCYHTPPNIFFFDRLSEGIKKYALENKTGWNVYEPNSCRMFSNLMNGVKVSHIVKYSEERISSKITERIMQEIHETKVVLLIVTLGANGLKFVYRKETGEFSGWNYLAAEPIENIWDSSGCGDWLTAIFLYLLLEKYPYYNAHLDQQYLNRILEEAQKYAVKNCFYVGAQGMLKEQKTEVKEDMELMSRMGEIHDPGVEWELGCKVCYDE